MAPIDLIIQLVSGAVGGNLSGLAGKGINLGWIWNTVLGLAGGAAGGHLLGPIVGPMIGVAAGASAANLDPMAILSSVATGGGSMILGIWSAPRSGQRSHGVFAWCHYCLMVP